MTTPYQLPPDFQGEAHGQQLLSDATNAFQNQRAANTANTITGSPWSPPQKQPTSMFGRAAKWLGVGQGNQANGDGGAETNDDPHANLATKDDLAGLKDSMAQGGGGGAQPVQNRMEAFGQGQQGGPQASGTQRPGVPNALTADHAQQALAMQQMQANNHASVSSEVFSARLIRSSGA